MKKITRGQYEEVIATGVRWLVSRWQAEKTQEEKKADHRLNERMDYWMKEITEGQRDAIEDCTGDILNGNGMCQLYLYEGGVKDRVRLMKMIWDMWWYVLRVVVILRGGFLFVWRGKTRQKKSNTYYTRIKKYMPRQE